MDRSQRSSLTVAIVLVLVGIWFLSLQLFPGLQAAVSFYLSWPLIIVGVGVLLLLIGILTRAPDMAVPACIVGGVGALLYYQNSTGSWYTWSYAWTLIPGFVGVGVVLAALLGSRRGSSAEGLWLIVISLILFGIFGSFLGGGSPLLRRYWPVLLILLGILLLARALMPGRARVRDSGPVAEPPGPEQER